jgi:hypothetical protein
MNKFQFCMRSRLFVIVALVIGSMAGLPAYASYIAHFDGTQVRFVAADGEPVPNVEVYLSAWDLKYHYAGLGKIMGDRSGWFSNSLGKHEIKRTDAIGVVYYQRREFSTWSLLRKRPTLSIAYSGFSIPGCDDRRPIPIFKQHSDNRLRSITPTIENAGLLFCAVGASDDLSTIPANVVCRFSESLETIQAAIRRSIKLHGYEECALPNETYSGR